MALAFYGKAHGVYEHEKQVDSCGASPSRAHESQTPMDVRLLKHLYSPEWNDTQGLAGLAPYVIRRHGALRRPDMARTLYRRQTRCASFIVTAIFQLENMSTCLSLSFQNTIEGILSSRPSPKSLKPLSYRYFEAANHASAQPALYAVSHDLPYPLPDKHPPPLHTSRCSATRNPRLTCQRPDSRSPTPQTRQLLH